MTLSAEALLAGGDLRFEVALPAALLRPGGAPAAAAKDAGEGGTVTLKPLTVRDLQRIARAAQDNDTLASVLTVQQALEAPAMSVAQVASMHAGLVQFLLAKVLEISGMEADAETLRGAAEAPLARAAFVLAQAYGWTPQEVQSLTLGQILLHLQMLDQQRRAEAAPRRTAGGAA